MTSAERAFLADLERRLASGEADQPEAALALLAGRDVTLDEDELKGARRRAVVISTDDERFPHRLEAWERQRVVPFTFDVCCVE